MRFIEVWAGEEQNAEIAASSSEDFMVDSTEQANKNKYGSANKLLIVNNSSKKIKIELDGAVYAELFGNSGLEIRPDFGKYFNFIRVTNLDSANAISANKITVRYARANQVLA